MHQQMQEVEDLVSELEEAEISNPPEVVEAKEVEDSSQFAVDLHEYVVPYHLQKEATSYLTALGFEMPIGISWVWNDGKANLPNRINHAIHDVYNQWIGKEAVHKLAGILARGKPEAKRHFCDWTLDMDWIAGEFGDYTTCAPDMKEEILEAFSDHGVYALRVFRDAQYKKGKARVLVVENNEPKTFAIFNPTGMSLDQFGTLISSHTGKISRHVIITNNGEKDSNNIIKVKNWEGLLFGDVEDIALLDKIQHIDLHIEMLPEFGMVDFYIDLESGAISGNFDPNNKEELRQILLQAAEKLQDQSLETLISCDEGKWSAA